jgi:hypothetical protein
MTCEFHAAAHGFNARAHRHDQELSKAAKFPLPSGSAKNYDALAR